MIWGVLQFPGSCDERDAVHACRVVGGEARLIWHEERDLTGVDGVVVPGGFSYGDYLRAGAIARFSPAMEAVAELAAAGGEDYELLAALPPDAAEACRDDLDVPLTVIGRLEEGAGVVLRGADGAPWEPAAGGWIHDV